MKARSGLHGRRVTKAVCRDQGPTVARTAFGAKQRFPGQGLENQNDPDVTLGQNNAGGDKKETDRSEWLGEVVV